MRRAVSIDLTQMSEDRNQSLSPVVCPLSSVFRFFKPELYSIMKLQTRNILHYQYIYRLRTFPKIKNISRMSIATIHKFQYRLSDNSTNFSTFFAVFNSLSAISAPISSGLPVQCFCWYFHQRNPSSLFYFGR